jgi:hypothetical protein
MKYDLQSFQSLPIRSVGGHSWPGMAARRPYRSSGLGKILKHYQSLTPFLTTFGLLWQGRFCHHDTGHGSRSVQLGTKYNLVIY